MSTHNMFHEQIFMNKYLIRLDYHTYPYKGTVKQFPSLQITASVLLSTSV